MKRLITVLCICLLLLSASACGGTTPSGNKGSVTSVLNPTFAAMPKKTQTLSRVYRLNEKTVLFEFITPGMDSSLSELVCYDLSSDTLLGELNPGDIWMELFPLDTGFAVLDYNSKTHTVYNTACAKQSTVNLAFDGILGSAAQNKDRLLLSDLRTGRYYVYDMSSHISHPVDEIIGAAEYTCAGNYKDGFLLYSYNSGIFSVDADGKAEFVTATSQSVQVVGNAYVGGVVGDYTVFRALLGGEAMMTPVRGNMESFLSADGNGLLSSSNDDVGGLHYYDLDRRTVIDYEINGSVVGAALWGTSFVAVVSSNEGEELSYVYADLASLTPVGMDTAAYDKTVIDDLRPLPEVNGVAAEILDTYGVTIIDDHDFFDMEPYGYTTTVADKEQVADRTEQLRDFLAYFPKGIFKELSTKAPVVIVLCQDLGGTAGGLNTLIDGYNVSFLSVTGSGEYFNGIAAHELAHAIERGMSLSDLDAWMSIQPVEVQSAYGNLSLTVEYTADDKGKTPVWFTDAYGRTNAMEDRATVFEDIYEAYVTGDISTLNYDGLKQKVDMWSKMLRNNFNCCVDASFPWDNFF